MLPPLHSEKRDADGLLWAFTVPADLPFFAGHFPGHPILPGVVLLEWMLLGAERFLGRPLGAVEVINLKFQVTVLPGALVELTIVPKGNSRLNASVTSPAGTHASALIPVPEQ